MNRITEINTERQIIEAENKKRRKDHAYYMQKALEFEASAAAHRAMARKVAAEIETATDKYYQLGHELTELTGQKPI